MSLKSFPHPTILLLPLPLLLFVLGRSTSGPNVGAAPPKDKTPGESAVHVSHRVTIEMADEHGRLLAGEMLKMIDIAAGVVARRHAGMQAVTISLDRFILLREMRVGDIVHLDAAVNRAWGSSMETGVKVVKEDGKTGVKSYSCHAYLTFVAISSDSRSGETNGKDRSSRSPPSSLRLSTSTASTRPRPSKALVPALHPTTLLERKRYLLAGRRRSLRTSAPRTSLSSFRDAILALGPSTTAPDPPGTEERVREMEATLLADALRAGDESLRVTEDGWVEAREEGWGGEKVRCREEDVRRVMEERARLGARAGAGSYSLGRRGTVDVRYEELGDEAQRNVGVREAENRTLTIADTLTAAMHIVMPQHANSVGVLFGGQLMAWMEEVALLAAHAVRRDCEWATAGMDGLEFRSAVAVGEVLTFRAVVLRVWRTSLEVYVTSHADQTPPSSEPRFTNDCFLTLVAVDSVDGRVGARMDVHEESDDVRRVVEGGEARRRERLEAREVLERVYAGVHHG